MENDEINDLADEHAKSFTQLTEIESVVIRGQVLVEKSLNRAIRLIILEKEEYKDEKFGFSQILMLGYMLGICTKFKAELNALNKLRNQIAHGTEFDDKFVHIIIKGIQARSPDVIEKNLSLSRKLSAAISFICGAIAVTPEFLASGKLLSVVKKTYDYLNTSQNPIK
ncbi:hypothetical protein [Mucilaginibacter pedocola]|uniref:Uncharacterized protein n=1 Tax=Mucilaginibacter pedocola TaxID=1792845 RepID=A0A1S9PIS8_9SPHI|nr:hypothetical protein [Mucilaginibacter pedocola]OOQ60871.1 hypothetical protein BC343_23190 [Mucilaginibacter pedocola]